MSIADDERQITYSVTNALRVVVAIVTYRRPQQLAVTLREIVRQVDELGEPARTLIVDNDREGSARAVVAKLALNGVTNVSVVVEPTPGIAAARNRALAESAYDRLLVFIDDDETPADGWLKHLVTTFLATGAAAVVGPVESAFDGRLDPWIVAGGYFERRRLTTGTVIETAASNNLLLDLAQVRAAGIGFDERFGLSGGSDTLFTRQLSAAGGRIVWCSAALVVDHVPAARMSRRWVLLRAMRYGNSWSRASVVLAPTRSARLEVRIRMAMAGLVRVGAGGARVLLGAASRSVRHRARGARTAAKGIGMIAGSCGLVYTEYARGIMTRGGGDSA